MDDLVVDAELTTVVVEDEDTNASTTVVEGLLDAVHEVALVKDREALLDITTLSHADDAAILTDIEDTVLLEDGTQHVLNNDRRSRVRDEAGLLMKLLGEQVNTEVTVLAGLGGGGNADHLARAALEDDQVANADVMAGDGDGVGSHAAVGTGGVDVGALLLDVGRDAGNGRSLDGLLDHNFLAVVVRVVVVVTGTVDGVEDTVSSAVETLTERMIVAVFVVVSHVPLVLARGINSRPRFDSNFFLGVTGVDYDLLGTLTVTRLTSLRVLGTVGSRELWGRSSETGFFGSETLAVLSLGDVNLTTTELSSGSVVGRVVTVELGLVVSNSGTELSTGVTTIRFLVSEEGKQ
jgi:hypothetical protein